MLCANSTEVERVCGEFFSTRVIVFTSLLPINVIGSCLVFRAIHASRELRKISTFLFIVNLALSDMLVPILAWPFLIAMRYHEALAVTDYQHLKTIFSFLLITQRLVSAFTLIALSVDKVFACVFHLKYNTMFTTARLILLICVIWAVSACVSLVHWAEDSKTLDGSCCQSFRPVLDTSVSIIVLICFLTILVSNLHLMLLSRDHLKHNHTQLRAANSKHRRIYENYKSIRSLALLLSMYGVGLLPLVIFWLIKGLIGCDSTTCTSVGEYLTLIHYCDLNTRFVIYCCRFRSLRNSVLKVMGCGKFGKQRVEPQSTKGRGKENSAPNVTLVNELRNGKVATISK